MAIAVRAWADDGGADSSKIRFIEIPPSSTIAALQANVSTRPVSSSRSAPRPRAWGLRADRAPYASISKEFITGAWFGNSTGSRPTAIRRCGSPGHSHGRRVRERALRRPHPADRIVFEDERRDDRRTNRPHFPAAVTRQRSSAVNVAAKYKEIPAAFRAQDVILSARG